MFHIALYIDIDECVDNIDSCADHATCRNTESSYTCHCDSGRQGDAWSTCFGKTDLQYNESALVVFCREYI